MYPSKHLQEANLDKPLKKKDNNFNGLFPVYLIKQWVYYSG